MTALVVWDFDGTLAYRPGMWGTAAVEALDRHARGHGVDAERLRPHLQTGFPWHAPHAVREPPLAQDAWWAELYPIFVEAFVKAGVDPALSRRAATSVRETYVDPAAWRVYADAVAALRELQRAGYTQVVLSNHVPELPELIAGLGLAPLLDGVFTSAALGYEKPDRRAFEAVLRNYVDCNDVVVVGDSVEADMRGASVAGLRGILVRTRSSDYESYTDLSGVVRALISGR